MTHPHLIGIVFDFDGTLANSLGRPLDAYHFAFQKVGSETKTDGDVRQYFGTGADRIFKQLIPDAEKAKLAFEHYLDFNRGRTSDTSWHFGVLKLLEQIRNEKIPTAVVTGRHSADLELVANTLSLKTYFGIQICDDHLENSKPHPEGIILAARKLGIRPSELMYVGDSLGDLEAAKAAGAVAIAALWDPTVDAQKLTANADYSANTPEAVWEIFKKLRKNTSPF